MMRSYWSRAGLWASVIGVLIKRGTLATDTPGGYAVWRQRQRLGWCTHRLRSPRDCSKPPESKRRQGKILPYRLQRQHSPDDILISDFLPLELWSNHFCCFKPPALFQECWHWYKDHTSTAVAWSFGCEDVLCLKPIQISEFGGGVKSVSLFWCNIFLPAELTSGFPGGSVVNNPPADEGDMRDMSLIPGSGRSPGGGNGNPLRYSCLGNPMDRGAWWATGVRHDLVTR